MFYGTGEEPLVSLGVGGLIGAMLSIGLALGVVLAVGGLLVLQVNKDYSLILGLLQGSLF